MAQFLVYIACGIGLIYLVSRVSGLVKYVFSLAGSGCGREKREPLPTGFPGRELFDAGQAFAD